MKLLSEIQYKAEERKREVTKNKEVTTYQLPQTSQSTAGQEYILTIPETQTVSIPVVPPTQTSTGEPVTVIAKVQQQQPQRPSSSSSSTQPATSYVVVDDQHPGSSRQMIYNPPSVAPSQCHLPLIKNSQDLPARPASRVRVSPNQRISPHKSHQTRPF